MQSTLQSTGAQLHAVYVVNLVHPPGTLDLNSSPDPGSNISIDVSIEGLKKILRHEGDEAMRYIEEQAKRDGVDVRKWIIEGQPAKEILKLAEEEWVDLIVMGTLGRSEIEKFLLGSVADKVIRGSRIPVLVLRK